jgi:hypothetical protein
MQIDYLNVKYSLKTKKWVIGNTFLIKMNLDIEKYCISNCSKHKNIISDSIKQYGWLKNAQMQRLLWKKK